MKHLMIYLLIFALFLTISLAGNHAVTVLSEAKIYRSNVILDAGHGGVDSGAVSCTGVYESKINLEITLKLNDLLHLLGVHTILVREDDRSVYTEGSTIAAKKISDIRNRVMIANTTSNALLISIHQNNFPEAKYSGSQVFYNLKPGSKELALEMQSALRINLNPKNRRVCQKSSGVYLMDHINCPGILIECGFLSNPHEESLLRNDTYQRKLCAIVATTISKYLNT